MAVAVTQAPLAAVSAQAAPGATALPDQPHLRSLSLRDILRTVQNPIDAWPAEVYREPLVPTRVLGRDLVFVCAPELVHQLLVDEAASLAREEFMLRALGPALGTGILTSDGPTWQCQRRAVAASFRHEQIAGLAPAMVAAAAATRHRWQLMPPGCTIDLQEEMMHTTFDIITRAILSGDAGLDVQRFGQAMADYVGQAGWKMALTMLRVPRWVPHPGSRSARRACAYLRATVRDQIAHRRGLANQPADLLALLLHANGPGSAMPMTDDQLVDNLLTFIAAGHETTALAMCWLLHLLAQNPAVEHRVLAEIAGVAPGRALTAAGIEQLVYTHQVVKEALRLFPPAPMLTRAVVKDIELAGHRLRRGTTVIVPIYAIHRHAALWAAPDRFHPDRFAPGAAPSRHRYSYMPFGAGPRICVGMGFALTEIVAILATLLPAVTLRPPTAAPPTPQFRITLRPLGGMPMRLAPRVAA